MAEQVREVAGREVTVTSPDKQYFPKIGLTKGDVIDYFLEVSDAVLNCTRNRPVLLQRFPNGVGGTSFFQKRIPDSAPEWLQTTTVETVNGTPSTVLVMADEAHLVWAVNLGAFTMHPWPFRALSRDVDELRIDLDPVTVADARLDCVQLRLQDVENAESVGLDLGCERRVDAALTKELVEHRLGVSL